MTIKLEDKSVESQSGKLEGKGYVHEQAPASKYNAKNPFVIRVNVSEWGTYESSSSKTTTNLVKAREEKDMRGHVSLPLKDSISTWSNTYTKQWFPWQYLRLHEKTKDEKIKAKTRTMSAQVLGLKELVADVATPSAHHIDIP
ncbi:hypothetical protein V6N13_064314 [Hibiscus sabdariffa]